ncbi:MAG TPA: Flp pilus assembly protein CpaB [Isosphaeraceae bacterium]|jgi:pilus assembly protein CpaB
MRWWRFLILLLFPLAMILGLWAALEVPWSRRPSAPVATVPVVVAAVDLAPGEAIARDVLQVRQYPAAAVPAGLISVVEEAVERVAVVPIAAGDLVLESKLSPPRVRVDHRELIPQGMRAVTLPTHDGVVGHVWQRRPDDRVDLRLTPTAPARDPDDSAARVRATTLVQDVPILIINGDRSVTVIVTPEVAERIDQAPETGTIRVAPRVVQHDE